ncbi:MAG TPA: hypothetical protein VLG66_07920 [Alphaproteobacteria bacterium]|nr:hypothetical protein [Alphaproteobacteria bacterium]
MSRMSMAELRRMAGGADDVQRSTAVLAKTGDNVVSEVLRGVETFYEWEHYPPDDVYDRETHSQFYYHAHPAGERSFAEHGHFHTFMRPRGMPSGSKPARLADYHPPRDRNAALSHIIAISMDTAGRPVRLFTTNRWVTGETWYAAGDVIRMVDRFTVGHAQPSWPTNVWITGMFRLFRPQIVALIRQRDQAVAAWRASHPRRNPYEDHQLEVISSAPISVTGQIAALRRALKKRA